MSSKKIIEQITKGNNFLITTHVNSEGDALGSELALYRLIKALKKNAVMANEDSLSYGYDFLPDAGKIIKYKTNLKGIEFDYLVTVDCSDLKRTGEVYKINTENKPVINIDHHISNAGFGDFNWIQPYASSCCEMIYELYKKLGVRLDKETALLLYVGISTDTGSFRYSNTTSRTHKIAAELLKYDIDVTRVYNRVHGNLPYQDMILVTKILNDVKCRYQGKIIWFQAKASLLKKYEPIYVDLTDHVMNFGRAIKGAEVVALFKENLGVKNEVRVNFRSQGKVDVNTVAGFFGGGGHKTASGCTIHGNINTIRRRVLKKIEESLKNLGM